MPTRTYNPTASNHDAREASGTMTVTGNLVCTSGAHWLGMIVPDVVLNAGETLTAARLYYKSGDPTRVNPNLNWYAQAADDPAVFTTTANDISSRARGTAVVSDVATGIGTTVYRTLDITSLFAEAMARPGWASGNNIALIGDGLGAGVEIIAWDIGGDVWYVEMDYSVAASGLTVQAMYYTRLRGGN